jgi:hypothetical protein
VPERVRGGATRDRRDLGAEQAVGTSELVERRRKGAGATSGRSRAVVGNEGPHCLREATTTAHSSPFPIRMGPPLENALLLRYLTCGSGCASASFCGSHTVGHILRLLSIIELSVIWRRRIIGMPIGG